MINFQCLISKLCWICFHFNSWFEYYVAIVFFHWCWIFRVRNSDIFLWQCCKIQAKGQVLNVMKTPCIILANSGVHAAVADCGTSAERSTHPHGGPCDNVCLQQLFTKHKFWWAGRDRCTQDSQLNLWPSVSGVVASVENSIVGDGFLMVDITNDPVKQLLKSMRLNYSADPCRCDGIRQQDQLLCIEYFTDDELLLNRLNKNIDAHVWWF